MKERKSVILIAQDATTSFFAWSVIGVPLNISLTECSYQCYTLNKVLPGQLLGKPRSGTDNGALRAVLALIRSIQEPSLIAIIMMYCAIASASCGEARYS